MFVARTGAGLGGGGGEGYAWRNCMENLQVCDLGVELCFDTM
jgi:hypothetical protein